MSTSLYTVSQVAKALDCSPSSVRNYADKDEMQDLLSDEASLRTRGKARRFTEMDMYVINTAMVMISNNQGWHEIKTSIREGVFAEMPSSSALVRTQAESFTDSLLAQQKIVTLTNQVENLQEQLEQARKQHLVDAGTIAVLEYRLNEALNEVNTLKGE